MATKADQAKAATQTENSAKRRKPTGVKPVTASMVEKRSTLASKKGRALHAKTKSRADAKAGKPGDGKKTARFKTGPNGGEDQTSNGVRSGRGADGPVPKKASRKSTRGAVPGGEKQSQLTRRTQRAVSAPSARAARGK